MIKKCNRILLVTLKKISVLRRFTHHNAKNYILIDFCINICNCQNRSIMKKFVILLCLTFYFDIILKTFDLPMCSWYQMQGNHDIKICGKHFEGFKHSNKKLRV